jgi:hydroxylysine kinase
MDPRSPDTTMDVPADGLEPVLAAARATGLGVSYDPIPVGVVTQLLEKYYGLSGQLAPIETEKDNTFLLSSGDTKYLVKVSAPTEAPPDVAFQTAAMLHVRDTAPSLPVQVPVAGRNGRFEYRLDVVGHTDRVLRVLTFLPGQLLADAQPTAEQVRNIGWMAGRLSVALSSFRHPNQDRTLIWDLRWFNHMQPLLRHISDERDLTLVRSVFDQFENVVVPTWPTLPRQVIHGDFNPHNVLVDPDEPRYVAGVIDFGDVVHTARVFDIAVGMANLLCDNPDDPWEKALQFVAGYLEIRHFSEDELRLLCTSALARLVLRVLIARWRAVVDPARSRYLLSHSAKDMTHVSLAHAVPEREVTARIRAVASQKRVCDAGGRD